MKQMRQMKQMREARLWVVFDRCGAAPAAQSNGGLRGLLGRRGNRIAVSPAGDEWITYFVGCHSRGVNTGEGRDGKDRHRGQSLRSCGNGDENGRRPTIVATVGPACSVEAMEPLAGTIEGGRDARAPGSVRLNVVPVVSF